MFSVSQEAKPAVSDVKPVVVVEEKEKEVESTVPTVTPTITAAETAKPARSPKKKKKSARSAPPEANTEQSKAVCIHQRLAPFSQYNIILIFPYQ